VAEPPKTDDVIDTAEETVAEPEPTPPQNPAPGEATGPMDAPSRRLKAPKTEMQLMRMTARELRAHAREFCNRRFRREVPKVDIVKCILADRNE